MFLIACSILNQLILFFLCSSNVCQTRLLLLVAQNSFSLSKHTFTCEYSYTACKYLPMSHNIAQLEVCLFTLSVYFTNESWEAYLTHYPLTVADFSCLTRAWNQWNRYSDNQVRLVSFHDVTCSLGLWIITTAGLLNKSQIQPLTKTTIKNWCSIASTWKKWILVNMHPFWRKSDE